MPIRTNVKTVTLCAWCQETDIDCHTCDKTFKHKDEVICDGTWHYCSNVCFINASVYDIPFCPYCYEEMAKEDDGYWVCENPLCSNETSMNMF